MIALYLDRGRGRILSWTMRHASFRMIYCNRALRLFFLFMLAVIVYLPLSLFFPIFVLVIGPIIWGFPHLIASLRFVPKFLNQNLQESQQIFQKRFFNMTALLFASVTGYRVYTDVLGFEAPHFLTQLTPEIIALIITAFGLTLLRKLNRNRMIPSAIYFAAIISSAWFAPLWFAGAIALLHNLVAFVYWILAARSQRELLAAGASTIIFIGISALILTGAFDFLYKFVTPAGTFAQLDYEIIGRMMIPSGVDVHYTVLFHCTAAYAFGQALHYFVWLKAIPDQNHTHQVAACFQKGFREFISEFGLTRVAICFAICIVGLALFAFVPHSAWRAFYFAAASYHGFMELAALPFAQFSARA